MMVVSGLPVVEPVQVSVITIHNDGSVQSTRPHRLWLAILLDHMSFPPETKAASPPPRPYSNITSSSASASSST